MNERGTSLVEYALLVLLIAVIAMVAVGVAGRETSTLYSTIGQGFGN